LLKSLADFGLGFLLSVLTGSRKITEEDDGTWTVSTLAGSGTRGHVNGAGATARFEWPYGVAVDSSGNIYVADFINRRIRKMEYRVP